MRVNGCAVLNSTQIAGRDEAHNRAYEFLLARQASSDAGAQLPWEVPRPSARLERAARRARWPVYLERRRVQLDHYRGAATGDRSAEHSYDEIGSRLSIEVPKLRFTRAIGSDLQSVRKNSLTLDGMCPSIQIVTLY